jgi:spore coat polysaccharide biosynthesis protein SpsF (cytidylyltransferase family)
MIDNLTGASPLKQPDVAKKQVRFVFESDTDVNDYSIFSSDHAMTEVSSM